MDAIKALGIYYEFKDLAPFGRDGDLVVSKLADRLVEMELFERAALLLDYQVRFRLEREERSKTGAKLALIYILSNQPERAVTTLENTGFGNNPPALNEKRALLAAKAMSDMKKYDQALKVIAKNDSDDAKKLKMEIYWQTSSWNEFSKIAEDMLANRDSQTAKLNNEQSETLIKLALAYNFMNDKRQLAYLRDYFTGLISSNRYEEVFKFVTEKERKFDSRNFDQVVEQVKKYETFLQSFRKSFEENNQNKES